MDIYMKVALILCAVLFVCTLVMGLKNDFTFGARTKITDAIFRYHMHCLMSGDYEGARLVTFEDMESYDTTMYRIWDWGYKRILPPDKFELIRPFIK